MKQEKFRYDMVTDKKPPHTHLQKVIQTEDLTNMAISQLPQVPSVITKKSVLLFYTH